MEKVYDIIILGSGPGGLTAAIYSGRYARKTLVIEGEAGGTPTKGGIIDNWPGIKGISGIELMNNFQEHAKSYGIEFIKGYAISVKKQKNLFTVNLEKDKVSAKTIIFALGNKTRKLDIPGEVEFIGKGVGYCATCDGFFFKNKDVVVIGGANSACKAAIYLGEICDKVTIIYRGEELRGEPIYLEKIRKNPKIEVIHNSVPVEIKGENNVESIIIQNKDKKQTEIKTNGVFVEIGQDPNNRLIEELGVKLDKKGYVMVDRDMKTNINGVFAIGDMTNTPFRQIITAAAEGAIAANQAHEFLNSQHH